MHQLHLKTEYSFRLAYGKIEHVAQSALKLSNIESPFLAITDRGGTWGHYKWQQLSKQYLFKPLYGVELLCVPDSDLPEKQAHYYVTIIAKNLTGLKTLYEITSLATEKFYYEPRISEIDLFNFDHQNIIIYSHSPNPFLQTTNIFSLNPFLKSRRLNNFLTNYAYYPTPEDKNIYQLLMANNFVSAPYPLHLLTPEEIKNHLYLTKKDLVNAEKSIKQLLNDVELFDLPTATLIKPTRLPHFIDLIKSKIEEWGITENTAQEQKTLTRIWQEVDIIQRKKFEDYFLIVYDLVKYAKEELRILVGPGRGSACGSFVCFLLGITNLNPLKYGLLFERFIDENRTDYPDIDLDFPDDQRETLFDYLMDRWGSSRVAKLGTLSQFKPRAALLDVCKQLSIPIFKTTDTKRIINDNMRSGKSDQEIIMQALNESGLIKEYPSLSVLQHVNSHIRHSGVHAAGVVITDSELTHFCSVDNQTKCAMIDKIFAEKQEFLKIDLLGLRTLTVIDKTIQMSSNPQKWRTMFNNSDLKFEQVAFDILNQKKFTGIFQFEGGALKLLSQEIHITSIDDLIALTSLARPGAMQSGTHLEFIQYHNKNKTVSQKSTPHFKYTSETFGLIIYQEQIMYIARYIGRLSWHDVNALRKGIGKTLGSEYMAQFKDKFVKGALSQGYEIKYIDELFEKIVQMGSYAFNKSHAAAYSILSYWCCLLKHYLPLEFACANLTHAKDEQQSLNIIRELKEAGYVVKLFDEEASGWNWEVINNELVGGFINIKGVGEKTAKKMVENRENGKGFSPRQKNVLMYAKTPFDIFNECQQWTHIFNDPIKYQIRSNLIKINEISDCQSDKFVLIVKIIDVITYFYDKEKGNLPGNVYLNIEVADETGTIKGLISRRDYKLLGMPLFEKTAKGDWILLRASLNKKFFKLYVNRWKKLTNNEFYMT